MKDEKIKEMVDKMRTYIDEGWSINVARKKVVTSEQSKTGKILMASQAYKDLLNDYMKKKNLDYTFNFRGGKLVCRSGKVRE